MAAGRTSLANSQWSQNKANSSTDARQRAAKVRWSGPGPLASRRHHARVGSRRLRRHRATQGASSMPRMEAGRLQRAGDLIVSAGRKASGEAAQRRLRRHPQPRPTTLTFESLTGGNHTVTVGDWELTTVILPIVPFRGDHRLGQDSIHRRGHNYSNINTGWRRIPAARAVCGVCCILWVSSMYSTRVQPSPVTPTVCKYR